MSIRGRVVSVALPLLVVDRTDMDIETRLLMLGYRGSPADPWTAIPAVRSALDKTFTADVGHFSNYAVGF